MKIYTKTIEQVVYIDDSGKETQLKELNDNHLLNAVLKVERDIHDMAQKGIAHQNPDSARVKEVLVKEILRRMSDF